MPSRHPSPDRRTAERTRARTDPVHPESGPEDGAPTVVLTPSTLNQEVRQLLEQAMPALWIEGEISNLARPSSGHLYFSLKDADAQVRCALFKGRAAGLRHRPGNGDQVRLRAKVSLYPARGEFQLIVEHLEDAGTGRLQRAFEALQARLREEGLFAPDLRQPLPGIPRRIAVITSPTGAAIRDVLSVLRQRFPALPVRIYPVPVQGAEAAPAIVRALEWVERRGDSDVILLTRGGGSLEDLWPFNEESVARAIHRCAIPVVSAVGHEVDVTIADLVADARAATPSAAAERLSPDGPAWAEWFAGVARRAQAALRRSLQDRSGRLGQLQARLAAQHPGRRMQDRGQRLDELEQRLVRGALQRAEAAEARLDRLHQCLERIQPTGRIDRDEHRLRTLHQRLARHILRRLEHDRERVRATSRALDAVSPLATLERGYAVVRGPDGRVLRHADAVEPGAALEIGLARGGLAARVERTWTHDPDTRQS